ncbi:HAMP domain-containing histidine kinase [Nonomuraea sp. FMUSA5-5]|uniref:histidine kinase n=1 Tax=Nonomuraea composti TaxID=2720023 RepID=A0ABX1ASN2_9ACTN|nr:HAMP domain-containing sensor histidine kinase [Nonomuraea sp. FMUSA5-5]NJP88650.1 HAMP domain-containing histidine kinase [Nonomuraea sp. FMUSA5-5]
MRARHDWPITRRITMFAGVMAALLSAMLAAAVMLAIHRYATEDRTSEIAADGGRVAHELEHDGVRPPQVEHADRNVQVVNPSGVVVASTPQLRGRPPMAGFTPIPRAMSTGVVCGGVFPGGDCHIVVAQSAYRQGQDWIVYSSGPTVPPYVTPWLAATVLGAATLMAVAITILGHRIVTTALRPVTAIRAELDTISDTCPERRVPLPPGRDEIYDLAGSVNRTLARLHAALGQQRHFTSDASHELRTPIAAIRTEVEDALYAPDDTTVTKLGTAVLGSLDRIEAIVGDLLTIARLEAHHPLTCEPIDLAALVAAQCRGRAGTRKSFSYELQPGIVVDGEEAGLSRLLTSLLDNAERHAASTVTLVVRRESPAEQDSVRSPNGVARLEVIDDGPGIEADKRELVFQRFARLDTARDRDAGGTGLGLAIARQIAQAHGGSLRLEDSHGRGARFVLRLPLAAGAKAVIC